MSADFWHSHPVAVVGGGSWGTVLAHLASQNCEEVLLWVRDEEAARAMNATRSNPKHVQFLKLGAKIKIYSELEQVFEKEPKVILWALPSSACREQARAIAPLLMGDEVVLHATKGVEAGTLKRISTILEEELPTRRIGVISGPNLATEIAKGDPAATVIASTFDEVVEAGRTILSSSRFRVIGDHDVVGVEWAGILKNILAIAAGSLDSMELGWNARAALIALGLAEMVRFGVAMGAEQSTFLNLAGVGDLIATCASSLSRNYQVGFLLPKKGNLEEVLQELGSTAEGVRTAQYVHEYASSRGIEMPITAAVYKMVTGKMSPKEAIESIIR